MSCAHEAIRLRQSIQPLFVLLLTVVVHRLIQLAPAMLARPLANLYEYHIRNLSNIIRHHFILPRIIVEVTCPNTRGIILQLTVLITCCRL